nr:hypothetical protein [Tanacetum cinerariifolium]
PRSQDRGKRESYKQGPKEEEPAPKALMALDGIGVIWLMRKRTMLLKNTENLNTKISKLNKELSDCETDLYHYKRGLSQVEARLVEFKEQEIKLKKGLDNKLTCFESASKDVDNLLGSQISDKNKEGLGYNAVPPPPAQVYSPLKKDLSWTEQVKKEKEGLDNKLTGFESTSKDLDTLLGSQRTDKNKEGLGYNAIPPPAQVYSPPKKDMTWTGLPEFANDTVTDYSRP